MKSRINKCIISSVENYTRVLKDVDLQKNIERIVKKSIIAFKSVLIETYIYIIFFIN